jgi:hypothetical protein
MNVICVLVSGFVYLNPMKVRSKIHDIQMMSNSTRKDILNDIVAFVGGALAAESVIQIRKYIETVKYENMIEDQLRFLNSSFY